MSVATECAPEIELPAHYVPSEAPSERQYGSGASPRAARRTRPAELRGPDAATAALRLVTRPGQRRRGAGADGAPADGVHTNRAHTVRTPADPGGNHRAALRELAELDAAAARARRQARAAAVSEVRLTRRGVVVAVLGALVCAVALVWVAWLSAAAHGPAAAPAVPASVTVEAGDTLWSVATRYAPDRDPRDEVDSLMRLNHLTSATLTPGQVLRLR